MYPLLTNQDNGNFVAYSFQQKI